MASVESLTLSLDLGLRGAAIALFLLVAFTVIRQPGGRSASPGVWEGRIYNPGMAKPTARR
jgi:hypothetical protein